MARVEADDVRLEVPLSVETVRGQGIDRLSVFDANGKLAFEIPVSAADEDVMANKAGVGEGQLLYEQHLGCRPYHGVYTVVATDEDGERLDFVTVEFNCSPDVDE
ncbi:hypothetical protein [Halovivax cerinus]|uniref:Uncharacterized protein n=1 Tax=Halovivax cerinus TaxID=1487865 RepID=A0ABD5NQG2_9EURY|nr:hypothetical protein [Halovivax cerinus]